MCCLWWTVWLRDAVRKSNPQKMTLARQRVLSSSEIRASDLEHEGSWVRIPSGAQIFSVSSYGWFFTSPFISFIIKVSLGICVSWVGKNISQGIPLCVFQVGEHISLGIRVSQGEERISLGKWVSRVGKHISLGICVSQVDKVLHKNEHVDHD